MSRAASWAPDTLDDPSFREFVGPLFEDAPRFLARLSAARPVGSWAGLFAAAERVALALPEPEAVELLDAHPRIGAPPETMSQHSMREQGHRPGPVPADGVPATERAAIQAELDRLNAAYEARFGFRFVVFVAGRPRSAIIPLMEQAIGEARDAEMRRGLSDVVAIARDRAARSGAIERHPDPSTGEVRP